MKHFFFLLGIFVFSGVTKAEMSTYEYFCTGSEGPYSAFTLAYERDDSTVPPTFGYSGWLEAIPDEGQPRTRENFNFWATIETANTRLKGAYLLKFTSPKIIQFDLSLTEDPNYHRISGHGTYDGQGFFINCGPK